jgi:hypothetical protein
MNLKKVILVLLLLLVLPPKNALIEFAYSIAQNRLLVQTVLLNILVRIVAAPLHFPVRIVIVRLSPNCLNVLHATVRLRLLVLWQKNLKCLLLLLAPHASLVPSALSVLSVRSSDGRTRKKMETAEQNMNNPLK